MLEESGVNVIFAGLPRLPKSGSLDFRKSNTIYNHFLSNNPSPDLRDSVYDICHRAGFEPKIPFECDSGKLIGEAAGRGLGILFSSRARFIFNQSQDMAAGRAWEKKLTFVPVKDTFCHRETYAAFLRNRYRTVAADMFFNDLLTAAAQMKSDDQQS